jgi:hydrogenase expression/formation protein HypC
MILWEEVGMRLGIPGKVVETHREHDVLMGKIDFGGILKGGCLEHVPEVRVGEYVLIHVGFALTTIDEAEGACSASTTYGRRPGSGGSGRFDAVVIVAAGGTTPAELGDCTVPDRDRQEVLS